MIYISELGIAATTLGYLYTYIEKNFIFIRGMNIVCALN